MDWWDYAVILWVALVAAFLPERLWSARARRRLGGLRQGRAVSVPCRYCTVDGPAPYPRRPVAGRLHSDTLVFRSRWGRSVPLPRGLTRPPLTREYPEPHWERVRYDAPDGVQHVFEALEVEIGAVRDILDAGTGAGTEPGTPVALLPKGRLPGYRPLTFAVLVALPLGAVTALTGAPGFATLGAMYAAAQAVAAVVLLHQERETWPEAYGKGRPDGA
ncbi:hypothetical protein AB0E83_06735 [Streptomyces sp. NPDC035033]|uniref:hypothetical protein n=1 Tax=Streptomyces sp. NPDC035033 TaxID=3155368 RepID=UPI0033D6C416